MLKDNITIKGIIHFILKGPNGKVKLDVWEDNLVVTTGKYHVADQMADRGQAAMSHMAVGTGTTPAVGGDTALETELDRNALTSTTQGTGANAHKVTYTCNWPAGDGTGAITEAAIFNSGSAGDMLSHSVFPVKNKGAADTLTMNWVMTFSA